MSGIEAVAVAALVILGAGAVLSAIRLVRGPSLPDRVVAIDTLLVIFASAIAVEAARTGRADFLDVMVVISLIGFTGTVTAAWFIEQRGAR